MSENENAPENSGEEIPTADPVGNVPHQAGRSMKELDLERFITAWSFERMGQRMTPTELMELAHSHDLFRTTNPNHNAKATGVTGFGMNILRHLVGRVIAGWKVCKAKGPVAYYHLEVTDDAPRGDDAPPSMVQIMLMAAAQMDKNLQAAMGFVEEGLQWTTEKDGHGCASVPQQKFDAALRELWVLRAGVDHILASSRPPRP